MATQSNNLYAEFDALTGTLIEREMTDKEIVELETIRQSALAEKETKIVKAAQRQALLDKLGITEEEARLLLGGN